MIHICYLILYFHHKSNALNVYAFIVGFVSVRSELQGEYYGTAIGGGIGAMIAVILIMFAGFGIYK